jgi:hypothetical protein
VQAGALPLRHFRLGRTSDTNPTTRGKTTEAAILWRLVELGKTVLIPWNDERYDLVVDEGDRFVRIRCKTGICAARTERGATSQHRSALSGCPNLSARR